MRYYFDLANGRDLVRDDVGVTASGPAEAIKEARAALVEMYRNEEAPEPGDIWRLLIRDEAGTSLGAISFDTGTFHEVDDAMRGAEPGPTQ